MITEPFQLGKNHLKRTPSPGRMNPGFLIPLGDFPANMVCVPVDTSMDIWRTD